MSKACQACLHCSGRGTGRSLNRLIAPNSLGSLNHVQRERSRNTGRWAMEADTSILRHLLRATPSLDWRAVDLDSEELHRCIVPDPLALAGTLSLLAAYQRLVRILPVG